MRLGIGSYTYGWASGTYGWELTQHLAHLTPEDLIDRAVQYELPLVQIVNRPALEAMRDDELKALAQYAGERGVEIELGTVGSEPGQLSQFLRVARILNSRILRTLLPECSPGLTEEVAHFKHVMPAFEEIGLSIAVENHETSSYRDLIAMIEAVGSDHLGVCLDTVNSLGRGEGVWEVADALLPLTLNLHVKDYTTTRGGTDMGFTVTGACTGQGLLDIPMLLDRMHAIRPDVGVILEQWTPITATIEDAIEEQVRWADTGVAYLKQQLSRIG